jgi:hypothetical protein
MGVHLQFDLRKKVGSASRIPLSADETTGFNGEFIVADVVNTAFGELRGEGMHTRWLY